MRVLLICICLAALASVTAAGADGSNLRLKNDHYLVEIRPPNGVIARIRDKERGLELLQKPRLAVAVNHAARAAVACSQVDLPVRCRA